MSSLNNGSYSSFPSISETSLSAQEAAANKMIGHILHRVSTADESAMKYSLPTHLEKFKMDYDSVVKNKVIKLPLIPLLSPRSQKRIALLPKPNERERELIAKRTEEIKRLNPGLIYQSLTAIADSTRVLAHLKHIPAAAEPSVAERRQSTLAVDKFAGKPQLDVSSAEYFNAVARRQKRVEAQNRMLVGSHRKDATADKALANNKDADVRLGSALSLLLTDQLSRSKNNLLSSPMKCSPTSASRAEVVSELRRWDSAPSISDVGSTGDSGHTHVPPQLSVRVSSRSFSMSGNDSGRAFTAPRSSNPVDVMSIPKTASASISASASLAPQSLPGPLSLSPMARGRKPPPTAIIAAVPVHFMGSQSGSSSNSSSSADLLSMYRPVIEEAAVAGKDVMQSLRSTLSEAELATGRRNRLKQAYTTYLEKIKRDLFDEMGLNLDENFTRKRKYGHALQILIFYVSTFKLQNAFSLWRYQAEKFDWLRKCAAATVISTAVRRMLSMNILKQMKLNIKKQRDTQLHIEFLAEQRRQRAARVITGIVRYKTVKRRARRTLAAITLQRIARGFIARTLFADMLFVRHQLYISALTIQCAYRQRLARRKVYLERKLEFVQQWMVNIKVQEEDKRAILRQHGAASRIASAFRTHRLRSFLRRLLFWHRMEIVMNVQRRFRGFMQRRKYKKMVLDKQRRDRRKKEAAVVIQKAFRRHYWHQKFKAHLVKKLQQKAERFQRKTQLLAELAGKKVPKTFKEKVRDLMPLKYMRDNKHATAIQRVYRGHRGRRRCEILRIKWAMEKYHRRLLKRNKAAVKIQKAWRGFWCRLCIKKSKRVEMLIRLQCFFRQKIARRVMYKKRATMMAFGVITRTCISFLRRRLARRLRKEEITYGASVFVLQRLARWYLGKRKLIDIKHEKRSIAEQMEYAQGKMVSALCAVQLRIIADSMSREINVKPLNLSKTDCPCNGPFQSLFIAAVGPRARTDGPALITNKLDSKVFHKFASKISKFIELSAQEKAAAAAAGGGSAPNVEERKKKKAPQEKAALLIEAIASDRFYLQKGITGFTQTELDLIFVEMKDDPTEGSSLTFKEFVRCIDVLANIHFKEKSLSKRSKPGKKSRDPKAPGPASASEPPSPSRPEPFGSTSRAQSPTLDLGTASKRSSLFDQVSMLTAPLSSICGDNPHWGLLLALNFMSVYRYDKWMAGVNSYLEVESRRRLGKFVTRIQCRVRMFLAGRVKQRLVHLQMLELRQLQYAKTVVYAQSILRRFIYRRKVARLAQTFIIKYVTHDGLQYWYNPSTRLSSWTKPKVLGAFECSTIPLPPTGLEVMVKCSNCGVGGEVTCVDCEDTYCNACFSSLHCKGNRRLHSKRNIPKCSYCKYQVATKHCLTCVMTKPARGTAAAYMKESDRGRYCDPCFCHAHDESEIELSKDPAKKKALNEFLAGTKESYIIRQHLHQKLRTNHKFESLVQTCEECTWRCASWRCSDCSQIYCHKCLVGLHSVGGPFEHHHAEKLPFYTKDMHEHYQHDVEDQIMSRRMADLSRTVRRRRDELQFSSVLRIQRWWRGRYYAREGRAHMKQARRRIRFAFRVRKREAAEFKQGLVYKLRDALGQNPPLQSDTREEAVLNGLNILKRQRAREYIWPNLEDWGWYRTSRTHPRKGIPRTGFDVGTIDELKDQARRGGFRMPGKVFFQNTKVTHRTLLPLEGILLPDQMIRVKEQLFYVKEVTDSNITLDRKWLLPDSPYGETLYRVPTEPAHPDSKHFKRVYAARVFMIKNPVTQTGIKVYISAIKYLAERSIAMAATAKKSGSYQDAIEWRDCSVHYNNRVKQLSQYVIDGNGGRTKTSKSSKSSKSAKAAASTSQVIRRDATGAPVVDADADAQKTNRVAFIDNGGQVDGREGEGEGGEEEGAAVVVKSSALASMQAAQNEQIAAEMLLPMHLRFGRQPGVPWIATPEELMIRKEEESQMSNIKLASTADDWSEEVDPMTAEIFFLNRITNEKCLGVPRAVQMKRQLDEESLRAKQKMEEAKAGMAKLEKKSAKLGSKKR